MRFISPIYVSLMVCFLCGSDAEDAFAEPEPEPEADPRCPEGEIHCPEGDSVNCIPHSAICDGKDDCYYRFDEDPNFCHDYEAKQYWWRRECDQGLVHCTRYGITKCMTPADYCAQEIPCDRFLDARVCRVFQDGRLKYLDGYGYHVEGPRRTSLHDSINTGNEFLVISNVTLAHDDCPQLYTKVGNECLSFLFPVKVTWGIARNFCNIIGGDLLTFRDLEHYTRIKSHMDSSMIVSDFWIGGRFLREGGSVGWRWLNGSRIPIGFPMWAVRYQEECRQEEEKPLYTNTVSSIANNTCYHYVQSPRLQDIYGSTKDAQETMCVAITYEHNFRYSDENCLDLKSPLCVAQEQSG